MKTLTLTEAAAFLKVSPSALRAKAKAGIVPGRKVGKRWVFVDMHLAEWIQEPYAVRRQALQGDRREYPCRSTNAIARGGFDSRSADDEYMRLLGLPTEPKPNSITTS